MMGQRLARTCNFDKPDLELRCTKELEVLVESDRRVAGDVLCKKGHTPRDWRKRVSIANG